MGQFMGKLAVLGSGRAKICVPLSFENEQDFLEQIELVDKSPAEIVEWRADAYDMCGEMTSVLHMLGRIRARLGDRPLIFTCRTSLEGGNAHCGTEQYTTLTKAVIDSGGADIADIELSAGHAAATRLLSAAKSHGVGTMLSSHNFAGTPCSEEISNKLLAMLEYDADIYKVAYMPHAKSDVLTLMHAATAFREENPEKLLVAISMGALGTLSRVAADFLESPLTFGSAGRASAPGQLDAAHLREGLNYMHRHCK